MEESPGVSEIVELVGLDQTCEEPGRHVHGESLANPFVTHKDTLQIF